MVVSAGSVAVVGAGIIGLRAYHTLEYNLTSNIMTYWPAGGGRGQNPENTAQGHSGQNSICP